MTCAYKLSLIVALCVCVQGLRANWTNLLLAIQRAKNETENQILIRDSKGLTEEQIKEYRQSFDHFDRVSCPSLLSLSHPWKCLVIKPLTLSSFPLPSPLPPPSLLPSLLSSSFLSYRTALECWTRTSTEPVFSVWAINSVLIQ